MNSDERQETIHQRHDTSYRFLLSSKKLFVELLRSFVHKGWVQSIDETNVQEIPHSFVLQDFKRKEADLVYRVQLNGQEVVFYLLLEMQSKVDFQMPYRLLLYQVEIWRYLLNDEKKARANRKSFRLPPIVPIVLYNGKQRWTAHRQFRKLLGNEEMFGRELLDFEYLLIDVARYTEDELLSLSNTIGSVFLLDQTENQGQLLERLGKLMHTIQQLPEDSQQKFVAWMANILLQKLPENESHLQEFIQSVKGDVSVMGLEKVLDDIERKGERKGEQKAKEEVAKRMIDLGVDVSVITAATGFSPDKIDKLREKSI
ncbi:Rpn family recombination-promoting nuclease/putative transposase [Paenibacillus sp. MSJ-34]|uniref:Rpn family recombination-promoting nuclease/putative transposase n=1 Tax=Paenibacillus sp. MSJ-34 TaxID=2841529 RepID=UPI001C0FD855|nr:Rpn family recombination-promoting nuclease/putative transposase [Paenibacillus sp. MSJ-34]MBU5445226.1 Rpn family recombination-promoting nuclease/putative transposase [Paenibacillus sp. MSJ-34]